MKEMKIDFKTFGFETKEIAIDVLIRLRKIAKEKGRTFVADFFDVYLSVMPCKELCRKILSYDKTLFEFGWTANQMMNKIAIDFYESNDHNRVYYYILLPTPTYFEPVVDKDEKEIYYINNGKYNVGYKTEYDANYIIGEMKKIIERRGYVTLNDVYEMVDADNSHEDSERYGWTDLSSAVVVKKYNGWYYIQVPCPEMIDMKEKPNFEEEPIDLERIACNVYTDWYDLEDLPEMIDDMMNEIEKELVHRIYIRTKNGEDVALDYNTIPEKLKAMEKDIVYTAYKTILADSEED